MKLLFAALIMVMGSTGYEGELNQETGLEKGNAFPKKFIVAVNEDMFEPLNDILAKNQSGATNFYIGQRCVAAGFVSVKLFEGNPSLHDENEKVRLKTVQLIKALVGDWGPSNGFNMTFDEFMGEVGPIIELYKRQVKDTHAEKGRLQSDFLLNDLNICKDLYWKLLEGREE